MVVLFGPVCLLPVDSHYLRELFVISAPAINKWGGGQYCPTSQCLVQSLVFVIY